MKDDNDLPVKRNSWKGITFFLLILLLFVFIIKNGNNYNNYKTTFKAEAVGLTIRIKQESKTRNLRYCFYVKNKKYIGHDLSRYDIDYDETFLEKFYAVKYDLNNPEQNYLIIEKKLSLDSITLVAEGFTKTKVYTYNNITSTYKEKSVWK